MVKAHNMILLCPTGEVFHEKMDQKTIARLREKFYEKYHNNSLTNQLYQNQHLYTPRMCATTQVKDHLDNSIVLSWIYKVLK